MRSYLARKVFGCARREPKPSCNFDQKKWPPTRSNWKERLGEVRRVFLIFPHGVRTSLHTGGRVYDMPRSINLRRTARRHSNEIHAAEQVRSFRA